MCEVLFNLKPNPNPSCCDGRLLSPGICQIGRLPSPTQDQRRPGSWGALRRMFMGSDATDTPFARARAAAGWTDVPRPAMFHWGRRRQSHMLTFCGFRGKIRAPVRGALWRCCLHSFCPHTLFESRKPLLIQCTPSHPQMPTRPLAGLPSNCFVVGRRLWASHTSLVGLLMY